MVNSENFKILRIIGLTELKKNKIISDKFN